MQSDEDPGAEAMTLSYIYILWPVVLPFVVVFLLAKLLALLIVVLVMVVRGTWRMTRWMIKEARWLVRSAHRRLLTSGR